MKPVCLASIALILSASTFGAVSVSIAADKKPRIEIPGPSEEIVLFENGKETKRLTVGKHSEEVK